ncbi:MAG: hypothetical protein JNM85_10230 [Chthonomonas sp.]|nr:hypothetical protein [Chthonomonas sp.]
MPELPEVESVRRVLAACMVGKKITEVRIEDDPIVFQKVPSRMLTEALMDRVVTGAGRKGKIFWLEFADEPWFFNHLGMSGWVRRLGAPETRLLNHGTAPLDSPEGEPRFLKWLLTAEDGTRVALTDGRRLARCGLGARSSDEPRVQQLGPDALEELPPLEEFSSILARSTAPIKAMLMNQSRFSGIGNWVADEVLYAAGIAPARACSTLAKEEFGALRKAIVEVLQVAVDVQADSSKFPDTWLFHVRWGGSKGADQHQGQTLRRDQVAGRTTAWVPERQR